MIESLLTLLGLIALGVTLTLASLLYVVYFLTKE